MIEFLSELLNQSNGLWLLPYPVHLPLYHSSHKSRLPVYKLFVSMYCKTSANQYVTKLIIIYTTASKSACKYYN